MANKEAFERRLASFVDKHRQQLKAGVEQWIREYRAKQHKEAASKYNGFPLPPPSPVVRISTAAKCAAVAACHDALCEEVGGKLVVFPLREWTCLQLHTINGVTPDPELAEAVTHQIPYEVHLHRTECELRAGAKWQDTIEAWLNDLEQEFREPPKPKRNAGRKVSPEQAELDKECFDAWQAFAAEKANANERPFGRDFETWLLDSRFDIGELTGSGVKKRAEAYGKRLNRQSRRTNSTVSQFGNSAAENI